MRSEAKSSRQMISRCVECVEDVASDVSSADCRDWESERRERVVLSPLLVNFDNGTYG